MKKILVFVILGFALVLVFGGLFLYNRPLGQAMKLDIPAELSQAKPEPQKDDDPPEESNKKTCGGKGLVKIISLGQSSPMEAGHFGADAVRLIWVDYEGPSVVTLALPSDLTVDADVIDPELDLPLNDIYQVVYEETSSNKPEVKTREATQAVAQAVLDNYGFIPDHYLTLQQEAFVQLVDTAEIVVEVEEDILDVPQGWYTFTVGTVDPMFGDQALDYVRILTPSDDPYKAIWSRFGRQNDILFALLKSATWDNLEDLPEMIKTARKMVVTDLSVSQMNSLYCMFKIADEQPDEDTLILVPELLIDIDPVNGQITEQPQNPENPQDPDLPLSIRVMIEEIQAGLVTGE